MTAAAAPVLSLAAIHQYVWARYVNYEPKPFDLDEDRALTFLERHYREHPIESDAECFYYGILAFERSFAVPDRRVPLLMRALEALDAYRRQTTADFAWETVEDRYREVRDALGMADDRLRARP